MLSNDRFSIMRTTRWSNCGKGADPASGRLGARVPTGPSAVVVAPTGTVVVAVPGATLPAPPVHAPARSPALAARNSLLVHPIGVRRYQG